MTEILITSSVLIAVIVLVRAVLRDHIRPGLQYALWGLVLLRLLVPVSWFESPVSVADAAEPIVRQVQQYSAENTRTVTFPVTMGEIPETGAPNEAVARAYIAPLDVARWIWLGGTVVLAAWFLFVNVRLARKLSRERKIYSRTHAIPVYVTKTLPSPCLYLGDIYLTEEAAADPARAEYIIAHELTHRRHLDGLWSALRVVCLAVWWFNPLVWLAAVLSRRDCELFCDAATVKRLGEAHRFDYGRTLLDMTAVNIRPGDLICSATTMSGSGKSLKERIVRIAQNRKTSVLLGVVVILIAAIAVGCTFSGEKDTSPELSAALPTPTPVAAFTEDDAIAFYTDYLAADLESFEAAEEYIWHDSEYTRQLSKENYQSLVYAAVLDTQMLNDNLCALQVELQSRPERPLETVIHYVGLTNGRLYIFKNSFIIPEDLRNGLENLTLETSPTEEESMYVGGSYWDEVNEVFGPFLEPVDVAVYMSDYYTPMETSDLTLEEFVNMTDGWEFHYYDTSGGLQLANDPDASIKISAEDGRALYIWNDAGIYICEGTSIITEITLGDMTGDEFFSYLYKWADSMAKPPVVIPDQFSGLTGLKKLPISEALPVLENPQYGVLGIFWTGHEGPYDPEELLDYLTGCTMTPIHWTEDNLNLPPADWDILIDVDASPIIYLGVAEVGVPHYAVIMDGDDYIVCVLNNGSQIYEDVKAILAQSEAIPAPPVSAATSYSPDESDELEEYTTGKSLVGEYEISALSKDFVLSAEWGYGTAEEKDWFTGEVIALETDWRRTLTNGKSTLMLVTNLCQDTEDPTVLRHREVYDAILAQMTYIAEDTEYDSGFEIYETSVNDYPAFVSVQEVGTYDSNGTQIDTNTEMSIVWTDDSEGRNFAIVINDDSTIYFSIAELTALAESVIRVN